MCRILAQTYEILQNGSFLQLIKFPLQLVFPIFTT